MHACSLIHAGVNRAYSLHKHFGTVRASILARAQSIVIGENVILYVREKKEPRLCCGCTALLLVSVVCVLRIRPVRLDLFIHPSTCSTTRIRAVCCGLSSHGIHYFYNTFLVRFLHDKICTINIFSWWYFTMSLPAKLFIIHAAVYCTNTYVRTVVF